jgi:hypothetical protein
MECINATNLHRKSGQWGTQPLLPVKQAGLPSQLANASRLLDGFARKINKVTASRDDKWRVVTFIRGRQIGWTEKKRHLRFASVPRHAGTGGMTISFKT